MLTPKTRKEQILNAFVHGDKELLPVPRTRKEIFLSAILDVDINKPTPTTREEMYLDAIELSEGDSGGSGSALKTKFDLPLDDMRFLGHDGYVVVQLPSEKRIYAINGVVEWYSSENYYRSSIAGWDKWHENNSGVFVYEGSSTGFFGGTTITLNGLLETSHNVVGSNGSTVDKNGIYNNITSNLGILLDAINYK